MFVPTNDRSYKASDVIIMQISYNTVPALDLVYFALDPPCKRSNIELILVQQHTVFQQSTPQQATGKDKRGRNKSVQNMARAFAFFVGY